MAAPLHRCRRSRQRGVSLIEALVALAVMGFGMLGIMGLQSSLRGNSDTAKQRSQAVRLAQESVERWRGFAVLETDGAVVDYTEIADVAADDITDPLFNTTFTRTLTVNDLAAPRRGKEVTVDVSWTDRTSDAAQQLQSVRLSTIISGIAPELGASLSVPGDGTPVRQPRGRNRGIPPGARDLRDGTSAFFPPGPLPNEGPRILWLFNNYTGVITLCTTTAATLAEVDNEDIVDADDNVTCTADRAALLGGYIRYSLGFSQPTADDAADPRSPPLTAPPLSFKLVQTAPYSGLVDCFTEDQLTPQPATAFFCAVPVVVVDAPNAPLPQWSGSLVFERFNLALATEDLDPALIKVCRYFADATLTNVFGGLSNRNFLVIRAGDGVTKFGCPAPTFPHQPAT